MSVNKTVKGRFATYYQESAQDLMKDLSAWSIPFSVSYSEKTGQTIVSARFEGDDDFITMRDNFDKFERKYDQQTSLLDENNNAKNEKEDSGEESAE